MLIEILSFLQDLIHTQDEKSISTYCAYYLDLFEEAEVVLPRTSLHFQVSGDGLEQSQLGSPATFRVCVLDGKGGTNPALG